MCPVCFAALLSQHPENISHSIISYFSRVILLTVKNEHCEIHC